MQAQLLAVSTGSACAEGYNQAICSVCADHYKKTKSNTCLRKSPEDRRRK